MNNIKSKIITTLFLSVLSCVSFAQTLKSTYFVEGVAVRHQLNPAFAAQSGYVGIPFLGNFGLSLNSNMGLRSFLYPGANNELLTFLHGDISSATALKRFKKNNTLDANFGINILQTGFYKWNGFNTFDINIKSQSSANVPYEMFSFLKEGMSNVKGNTYDLSDVSMNTQNFVDLAFGHSRQINDKIRVGAKMKFLLGVANANADFKNMNIYMSQDKWMIDSEGELISSGLEFETDNNGEVTGASIGDIGLNGFGVGFDLGATYNPIKNLEVSLAVLDLGFIKWKNSVRGATSGVPFVFEGFDNIDVNDDGIGQTFDDQMDNLQDDLEAIFKFYEMKSGGRVKNTRSTNTTLNIGGEYSMFENRFSVGVLSSTVFCKKHVLTDFMVSANYTPIKWFTLTGNASASNVGWTWGCLLNFSPKRFNLFLGTTMVASKFSPQLIPVNRTTMNVNLGMSVYLARNTK